MCKIDFSTTFLNKSFPHWLYDVLFVYGDIAVSYTHLRAHETDSYLVCRLLLEKKKKNRETENRLSLTEKNIKNEKYIH